MPDGDSVTAPAAITPTETITVQDRTVACDGGGGALGHPRVFLRIAGTEVMCPYCSRLYVLAPGAGGGDHH
ncbi:Zinc-finger domain-containing protein [Rhodovastum atsumiense]|uniref:Zinc-finger domain-containing protein n=1 Tax=Rhodovastum atsumiense TaxID=504468 RepID=A0A5M6IPW1_9PROT|nr:zinc-finger domain-containing protein [Rhodovastum atsumiense]KAA5610323.1 zinc-finger domain-containing protein [Rhodovastum atsumiense]CAH2600939.1 Zinc-finger domain-containing protein [Rhodovastum atsumiense]